MLAVRCPTRVAIILLLLRPRAAARGGCDARALVQPGARARRAGGQRGACTGPVPAAAATHVKTGHEKVRLLASSALLTGSAATATSQAPPCRAPTSCW